MYIFRFFLSLLVTFFLLSSQFAGAAEPTQQERASYILGLKAPIRLPIFYDDSSYLRFVSRTTPLSDLNYAPSDLVSISGAVINQAGRNSHLRKEARDSLWEMASGFRSEYNIPLTVISGYRSAAYQQRLWDLGRCRDSLCAPPGYSEHQLGLAIDAFDASTEKEFQTNPTLRKHVGWLQANAHLYGWTQSYQKGVEVDEYDVEPWHYRYVGTTLAKRLYDLGWTYTEFVRFQEAIQRR